MIWLLSLVIAYFGIYCGVFISSISPSELKTGIYFFYGVRKIILSLVVFFSVYYLLFFINFRIASIVAGVITLFFIKVKLSHQIFYFIFPVILFLLSNSSLRVFFLSLFFFYGIILGSEEAYINLSKNARKFVVSIFTIMKKATIKTNLFFISFSVVFIISLF